MARVTPVLADFAPGESVVYRAPHVRADEPGEEGTVSSVGDRFVFVRFGHHGGGVACEPWSLERVFRA